MSVSIYNNNSCKYNIDKLDNVVYLINENALKKIYIDNGEAYIDNITQEPISFKAYNITLSDTDELDERYKFTHQLNFTVNGYVNYRDFNGRYYAIVKTIDGEYWLVNPLFPCKVTYTYTLDSDGSRTSFVLSTISNHPTLRIHGMAQTLPYECGYQYCKFDSLSLNETIYSIKSGNNVKYTNDGFKSVFYNRNSATFTEAFDGEIVQHSITFNIRFDDYKDSWHYNLLEFTENKYAAIIKSSCGKYILVGFHFGLQPSFSVSATDTMEMDNIRIQLIDNHDNGDVIGEYDEITEQQVTGVSFQFTSELDGYECVSEGVAKYLLKKEVDAFGNPTRRYQCLQGYESQFAFLGSNLVGTFSTTEEFDTSLCGGEECKLQTTIPTTIVFNAVGCKTYSLVCDSDWSFSSANGITISPTSGVADQTYAVEICNTITPTETEVTTSMTLSYCNTSTDFDVVIREGDGCLPASDTFEITAAAQYINIPIQCCVLTAVETSHTLTNITIQSNYIRVYVPQNNSGVQRTFTISITLCDGRVIEATIIQDIGYERWVKEGTTCVGNEKCDVERKYTGTTPSDINTRTEETRTTNCVVSSDCGGSMYRWVETSDTMCSGGKKYKVEKEQVSTDGGTTWSDTGNKRQGTEVPDPSGECEIEPTYEYRWYLTYTASTCIGYDRYYLYKKQRRESGSSDSWEDVIPTVMSYNGEGTMTPEIMEHNATSCGYVPPTEPQYKWVKLDASQYMCDECG